MKRLLAVLLPTVALTACGRWGFEIGAVDPIDAGLGQDGETQDFDGDTDAGLDAGHVRRLGVPDRFIEHADRGELLAELALDHDGIVRACREMAERVELFKHAARRRVS